MSTEINLGRLNHFMKRQLYMNISSMWVATAAVVGALLVISGLTAYFNPLAINKLIPLYIVVLFLGGYIFTSRIFNEMHVSQKSYAFLTLPVSIAEKLIGAWLIVAPIYIITALTGAFLLIILTAAVAGQPIVLPNISDPDFIRTLGSFIVTQTFFFLGAIAFKGNNFFKTLLALFIIAMLWSMYGAGLGYLLFEQSNYRLQPGNELQKPFEFIFREAIPFMFWYVLGPFLLLVAYFKLKERQV
jgi:MFS family permease